MVKLFLLDRVATSTRATASLMLPLRSDYLPPIKFYAYFWERFKFFCAHVEMLCTGTLRSRNGTRGLKRYRYAVVRISSRRYIFLLSSGTTVYRVVPGTGLNRVLILRFFPRCCSYMYKVNLVRSLGYRLFLSESNSFPFSCFFGFFNKSC